MQDISHPLQATLRPVALLATDHPGGFSFPSHAHRRGQLLHAIRGILVVRSATGSWVVPPGRAVWLPPMVEHDVIAASAVEIRTVFVEPDARPDLPLTCCVIRVDPFLRELIIQGSHLPLDYEVGGRSERIMELILDEIQAAPVLALHVPMPRHPGLTALCASLLDQPSTPALQKDWAARLHMNERTFARLFRREVGMTFGTWLRQARLLLSLTSLAQGHSILRVALDHGYESPSAFAAAFRRMFGLPPSAYLDKQRSHPDLEQDR